VGFSSEEHVIVARFEVQRAGLAGGGGKHGVDRIPADGTAFR
jgi:hypothetical protein